LMVAAWELGSKDKLIDQPQKQPELELGCHPDVNHC